MKNWRFILTVIASCALLLSQVGVVFAAPASQQNAPFVGKVLKITLEIDPSTGFTTVLVKFKDQTGTNQTVRLSALTAQKLGLLGLNGDGNAVINSAALGLEIEIDPSTVLPSEQPQQPVANALAVFFSDIDGLNYDIIMAAHKDGNGFGVITQALLLIRKLDGNADDFLLLLNAKRTQDFSDFQLEDGTIPRSWGEFKKGVADNLGTVISHSNKENNGNHSNENNNGNNDDGNSGQDHANDNSNNGSGNGNGHGNGNGNIP